MFEIIMFILVCILPILLAHNTGTSEIKRTNKAYETSKERGLNWSLAELALTDDDATKWGLNKGIKELQCRLNKDIKELKRGLDNE